MNIANNAKNSLIKLVTKCIHKTVTHNKNHQHTFGWA